MRTKRTILTLLLVLTLVAPLFSVSAEQPMAIKNGEVSGALTGNMAGSFKQYEVQYPGGDSKLEIKLYHWPPNPLTGCGIGFKVYGWNGFEGQGVQSSDDQSLIEFTYQNAEATTFLVQVQCYSDGQPVSYRLVVSGAAEPVAAVSAPAAPQAPIASDAKQPAALTGTISGASVGNSGGALQLYPLGYQGHAEDATVKLNFWPSDPSYDAAIGFQVYDPLGRLVADGQRTENAGERVATINAERGGQYAIQVFNYTEAVPVSYQLKVDEAANGDHYVDMGGYRLHAILDGAGGPTVVMEAGLSCYANTWDSVAPAISQMARTLTYDRAGVGSSDFGPDTRSYWQMATDLHTLLQNLRLAPPYLLVGHSAGGFTLRMFAGLYPSEVAGIVFVDASHEDNLARYQALMTPEERKQNDEMMATIIGSMPKAVGLEWNAFQNIASEVPMMKFPTNVPVVSLVQNGPLEGVPALEVKSRAIWLELHNDWLKLMPQAKQVLANKSGHFIQINEPELVIQAVRDVLAAIKK